MIKVFIVDDSEIELDFMREAFKTSGIDCMAVSDPTIALKEIINYKPDFIILDLIMPTLNGLELCTELKTTAETVSIPVMFLTASESTTDAIQSVHLGVIDFINKPITRQTLVETIIKHDSLLSLRSIFSPLKNKARELEEKYSEPLAI
jgi:DNA-binding response OmpR family regulator